MNTPVAAPTERPFKPIPAALCVRIAGHAETLRAAESADAALAALFLLHCECKAALELIPAPAQQEAATP